MAIKLVSYSKTEEIAFDILGYIVGFFGVVFEGFTVALSGIAIATAAYALYLAGRWLLITAPKYLPWTLGVIGLLWVIGGIKRGIKAQYASGDRQLREAGPYGSSREITPLVGPKGGPHSLREARASERRSAKSQAPLHQSETYPDKGETYV